MNEKKHKHGEAFMQMHYFGQGRAGSISLRIWNSRDGVTPFITFSQEYGIQLQHENWIKDVYMPNYKPVKGDLIWASHTEETAKESAEKSYKVFSDHLNQLNQMHQKDIIEKYGFDGREQLTEMLADKEAYISKKIHEILYEHGEPQPRLQLVEEDWK